MQISRKQLNPTKLEVTIAADQEFLSQTKSAVLAKLAQSVSLSGFRKGKAPLSLVEKAVDPTVLQREFLDRAVNDMYLAAVQQEHLRPVSSPEVNITKFVPFATLEIKAEVEAVGNVTLPDYAGTRLPKPSVEVTTQEVETVLRDLQRREAARKPVKRPAGEGDEVTIDFKGVDAKTMEPIAGTDGKDYPLLLGSNAFIPGFEPELVGLKAGQTKNFDIIFPKDYGVAALQGKEVTFDVKVNQVAAVTLPKLNDDFAGKVGPFKTMSELNADIRKQLMAEKSYQTDRQYENELLMKLTGQTQVAIPTLLVDEEIDRLEAEEKRNLMYRGQTWPEHLEAEGVTEAEHRERQRETAENRVKSGLMLGEVAEKERIVVAPEELDTRLQQLRGQYTDKQMQAELNKPEARREILNRLVSEKTIERLVSYATGK